MRQRQSPVLGECGQFKFKRSDGAARKNLSDANILGTLSWRDNNKAAQLFANAINRLRLYARNYETSRFLLLPCLTDKDEQSRIWAEFHKRAAAWHALSAKPSISDDVKQHRLLAEDACRQKQFYGSQKTWSTAE